MPMTIANVEMAKAWEEEGERWIQNAERYEAMDAAIWQRLLDATPIGTTDRVLDIGCGTGKSSRDVARLATSGSVLAVDLSPHMLAWARERAAAEGLRNVEFILADAEVHPFEEATFDVAVSCFGAMFFGDRAAAFRNIAAAVRPGGRLAFLAWQPLEQNEWVSAVVDVLAAGRELPLPRPGAPGPFGLADADGVRQALSHTGFEDVAITAVREPLYYGRDAEDAWTLVRTMGIVKGLSESLDEETRADALHRLRQVLADHETASGVLFGATASLITARRPNTVSNKPR